MKSLLVRLLCCVSCGGPVVVSENAAPKEKTCEYVVSGLCVNTNGHDVDATVVQGTLDVVYPLVAELFGEFDMEDVFVQNSVSVDFVSGDEIGYFCKTSKQGCVLTTVNESSIYVRLYDDEIEDMYGQEMDEWFVECAWPGNVFGHELFHLFNAYVNEADWKENMTHATPGLFGVEGVEGDMNRDMNQWCFFQKGEK